MDRIVCAPGTSTRAPTTVDESAPTAAPLLWTPDDLAAALQVSVRTLRRQELLGKIGPRPLTIGRAIRYRVDEVRRWIAAGVPDRDTWRAMVENR